MLFQHLVQSSIKQTTIIPSQEEDILCWKLTQSCKCTKKISISCMSSKSAGTWWTSADTSTARHCSPSKTDMEEQANHPTRANFRLEIS
jgi:hypothetical protein